jgi:hypothetical protein
MPVDGDSFPQNVRPSAIFPLPEAMTQNGVSCATARVIGGSQRSANCSVRKRDVTLKPGDAITVTGWLARDGTAWGHSREVTFKDGKKLFFGPPAGTGDGGNVPPVPQP